MNGKNLGKDEFIGLHVKILDCTDPNWKGQNGTIVDETKNTFLRETNHGNKKIAKKTAVFEFKYDDEKFIIDGKKIAYRPEDRIKKVR